MKATIGWRFQCQWPPQRDRDCEQILNLFRKERIMRKKSRSEIRVKQGAAAVCVPSQGELEGGRNSYWNGYGSFVFARNQFSTVISVLPDRLA